MTKVAHKFKIFSKRTFRGSALVTLSDTKQGLTVPRGKQRSMENELCNICKFCTCLLYLCLLLIYFFQPDMIFFYGIHFEKLSFRNILRNWADLEVNINLAKIVVDDNNNERKSWACLGQTYSRSLIVFLSQLFLISLIIFGCFWRIHLSKTCDESTVLVGIFCSAAGYKLPSPRLWTS